MKKAGTPTMGGVLIILSVLTSTLLWANLRNPYVWVALFGMVSFGAIDFYTQWFERLGASPQSVLVGGLLVLAFALGLWMFNQRFTLQS